MKAPVLFIFLLLILITGNAQPPVFNKLITFIDSSYNERLSQVIEVDDGYLLAGNTEIHSVGHYWVYVYLVIVKIDRQGNIVKRLVYGDTTHSYDCPPLPALVKTDDGNLVLPLTTFRNTWDSYNQVIMMKLTPDGDSLITTMVIDTSMVYFGCNASAMAGLPDKGYIMTCYFDGNPKVCKLDSMAKVKWITAMPDCYISLSHNSIFTLPENDFLLGYVCSGNGSSNGFAAKVKSSGSWQWTALNSGIKWDDAVFPFSMDESNFYAFSTVESGGSYVRKPFVLDKIDSGGNVLWSRQFGPADHWFSPSGNVMLPDSTWLGCGHGYGDTLAWIVNYTDSASEVFYKKYSPPYPVENISEWGFSAAIPTSDQGLLMTGYLWDPISFQERPWIVKTDRYGCSQPGCDPDAIYILIQPQGSEICQGESAAFAFSCTGKSINLQWQIKAGNTWQDITEGHNFNGSHNNILHLFYSGEMEGNYSLICRIRNGKYTLYTQKVFLKVNYGESITKQPTDQNVHLGDTAHFSISVSGSPSITYQWYQDTTMISGATDSTFSFLFSQKADTSAGFRCRVSNMCNESISNTAHIRLDITDVREPGLNDPLFLYPNPAHDRINLRFEYGAGIYYIVKLFDVQGRMLRSWTSNTNETCLDLNNILPGIYFAEVGYNDAKLYRKVMIR